MNEITIFENKFEIEEQYAGMVEIINQTLPEINRATNLFNKTQSQFMDNMLTVSHITPIRNLRQILAEIKRTRQALGEAYYAIQKKRVEIEKKQQEKVGISGFSPLNLKRLDIEIEELDWQISCIQENVSGAIRKLTNYSLQYKSIQEHYHLQNFNEQDFEEEEERYHITKAFEQALNAARVTGRIDEGNQIYLEQLGINGTVAQVEVINYLNRESYLLSPVDSRGNPKLVVEPTHEMQLGFLLSMADKFKGCTKRYAAWKGMADTKTVEALVK